MPCKILHRLSGTAILTFYPNKKIKLNVVAGTILDMQHEFDTVAAFCEFMKLVGAIDPTSGYRFIDRHDKTNYYDVHISPDMNPGEIRLNSTFGSILKLKKSEVDNLRANAAKYLHLANQEIDPRDCKCNVHSVFFLFECNMF